jgi:TonB-dependent SusC/RagA subfamily outer membrane receptor
MRSSVRWKAALMLAVAAAMLGSAANPAAAQAVATVRGTVTSAATQRPLAGVQVSVARSSVRTVTNASGAYTLANVPAGTATIRAELIGYTPATRAVTVAAGQTATANLALAETAIGLDELVVTGQAKETRRREVATSVASLDATELENAPIQNVSQLLQGRTPGVNVLPGGGKVGQGTKILLRGPSSVSQGIQPLIFVDGVRVNNSTADGVWTGGSSWTGLDDINPNDIERVEIVKGAAAASLYGTEASAGVVQIFTKKGKQNTQEWNYSSQVGVSTTPSDWWGVSVFSDWFYDNYVNNGAQQQEHQLSTSGGREGFSYYASGTYRNQEGILPGNDEGYLAFRGNLQIFPRKDLVVRMNTGYSDRDVGMPQDANNIYGYGLNALSAGPRGLFMPVDQINLIEVGLNSRRFTGSLNAEHTPSGMFTQRVTVGMDVVNADNTEFHPYGGNSFNPFGRKTNYRRTANTVTADYAGILTANLTSNVKSTLTGGFQAAVEEVGASSANGRDFPVPGLSTVGAAATTEGWEYRLTTKSAGFIVQEELGFHDRLFVNVGFRADGHSAFGKDHPYQFYPKGGVSYVLSEHAFFPDFFDSFRVRAAYGTAGRQPGAFDAVQTWQAISALDGVPAVTTANRGNPKLAPEVSHELEAGFDASLVSGRLGLDFTWYNQRTEDALLPVLYSPSAGFIERQLENVGEIRNRGVELAVNATLLQRDNFQWNANANYSRIKNEILDLGPLPELYQQWTQVNRVGYPVAAFFGDRFVMKNGEVVEVKDDYIGPAFPSQTFQLGTDFTVAKRLKVRGLLDHSGGHYVESSTVRWLTRLKVRQGDSVAPEATWGKSVAAWCQAPTDPVVAAQCATPWPKGGRGNVVRPADYWKLREVSVSYTVPNSLVSGVGFRNAEVYVSGRNLWRKQDFMLLEAEANYATDRDLSMQEYFNTPVPRQFLAGIRLGF